MHHNNSKNIVTLIQSPRFVIKIMFSSIIISIFQNLSECLINHNTLSLPNIIKLDTLGWTVLSIILMIIILTIPTILSGMVGWRLNISIFLLIFVLNTLLVSIEGYFFLSLKDNLFPSFLIRSFRALIITFVILYSSNKLSFRFDKVINTNTISPYSTTPWSWIWRIVVCLILYMVLFMISGVIATNIDFVKSFYQNIKQPTPGNVFTFIFIRGLLCILVTLPFIRSINIPLLKKALLFGSVIAILGGVEPLIVPNQMLPPNIRYIHMLEVVISNFLYGIIICFLFGAKIKGKYVNQKI